MSTTCPSCGNPWAKPGRLGKSEPPLFCGHLGHFPNSKERTVSTMKGRIAQANRRGAKRERVAFKRGTSKKGARRPEVRRAERE